MKRVLILAAMGEAATGLGLLTVPSLVGRVLLGVELSGVSVVVGRVTGIALVGLSIACWPGRTAALRGMLTYSALVTAYLAWVGIRAEWVGSLLWPAVVLHVVLTILLVRACLTSQGALDPDSAEIPLNSKNASTQKTDRNWQSRSKEKE